MILERPWLRGATVLHQPGDLMPVEVVGVHLCQHLGDPETLEL